MVLQRIRLRVLTCWLELCVHTPIKQHAASQLGLACTQSQLGPAGWQRVADGGVGMTGAVTLDRVLSMDVMQGGIRCTQAAAPFLPMEVLQRVHVQLHGCTGFAVCPQVQKYLDVEGKAWNSGQLGLSRCSVFGMDSAGVFGHDTDASAAQGMGYVMSGLAHTLFGMHT